MKPKESIYWTQKDGTKINVDDMDIQHLRNVLKLILRTTKNINFMYDYKDEMDATEIDIY